MDYRALANDLFSSLAKSSKAPFQKAPRDISHGEVGILVYLCTVQDGISSGDLSKFLNITTGRVATALNSLEKKNFIERCDDSYDKRKVLVYVTEIGRRIAMEKHEEGMAEMEKMLRLLGENDAKELVRIVKRVIVNYQPPTN